MTTLFVACAALGAGVLAVQIVLGISGMDQPEGPEPGLGVGLELLSVRAISAGVAFAGLGGLGALSAGLGGGAAVAAALFTGISALLATAYLTCRLLALESDGSLRVERAIGEPATVYLTVPAADTGVGKVHLDLQGRTVELQAVTREGRPLPTGTPVVVVAIVDPDTVEVLPSSSIQEVLDGTR